MITLTKEEHAKMLCSAESTFIAKCLSANERLRRGEDINNLWKPISVAFCNLISLKHYDTGEFEAPEYFNVSDPTHVTESYSNVNTINT